MSSEQLMSTTFFYSCGKDNFNEKLLKTILTIFNIKSTKVWNFNLKIKEKSAA
jgi:hypothetical protein